MSVASCLKNVSGILAEENIQLVKDITAEYVAGGMKPLEAGNHAIREVSQVLANDHARLVSEISKQGGVVPTREAAKLSPAFHGSPADFSEKDVDIETKLSPVEPVPTFEIEPSFDAPEVVTLRDKFFTAIVDEFHSLTKTQKIIGPVAEDMDVDMAIVRFPGMSRARVDDFEQGIQQDLLDSVRNSGLSHEAASEFLLARHAEEANLDLEAKNPKRKRNKALSGMSTENANTILEKYKGNEKVQKIGEIVDIINEERLVKMVDDGLLTTDQANFWRGRFKHYIPLQREETEDPANAGVRGRGFDVRGHESKLRGGSEKLVDLKNMFAHIFLQNTDALIRGDTNRVSQSMFKLADANPNPKMWSTTEYPTMARKNADGTVTQVPNMQDDYLLAAKFEGETKYVYFKKNNPHAKQIAEALKKMASQDTNGIVRALSKVNRFLAMINTSLSPEFMATNPFRDVQTAVYNLTDTELKGMEAKVLKSIPKSLAGIKNALRGDGSHEYAKIFEEFRREGGMTGWVQSHESAETRMKQIQWELKQEKHFGLRKLKGMMKAVSDYNIIFENGVRLAAYKEARAAGLSKAKAAKLAKELTVNFNRRGEMAILAGSLYLFYNASVQGSARMLRAIGNPKNHRLHKMLASTVAISAMIDILNRMSSDDDEEGRSKYDLVRDRYGERNLIIMDWMGVTDDEEGIFLKIPSPWGFNTFQVLGQEIGSAASHAMGMYPEYKVGDVAPRLISTILGAFNPLQDGSPLQTISPTLLDPIVRVSENRDWHGGKLYPNYDPDADNATKFFSGARKESRFVADLLAETFRDKETLKVPQIVDVSPEWIDMGFDFFTGSLGRFAADTYGMAGKLITGEPWEYKEMPIARKVVGNVAPSDIKSDFYDSYYEVLDINKRIRNAIRDGYPERAKDMSNSVGPRLKLIPLAKATKSKLRKIKKQMNKARREGSDVVVKRMEKKQLEVMKKYSKIYNRTIYGK